MKTFMVALGVMASAALSGCAATAPDPVTRIKTEAQAPKPIRLVAPVIVTHEAAIELSGPELTASARARFKEERAARVAERSRGELIKLKEDHFGEACVKMGILIPIAGALACPFGILGAVMTAGMVNGVARGVKYAVASVDEPSLRLSAEQAERIAAALREQAISAALVERALYIAPREFASAEQAESRLVVRMDHAGTCEVDGAAAICLVARAQAFLLDGTEYPPSQHVFVHGPLEPLAGDPAHLERTIDQALDLLAESIVATYTGSGPLANLPPEEAPEPAAAAPTPATSAELRKLIGAERSVFPRSYSGGCREDC